LPPHFDANNPSRPQPRRGMLWFQAGRPSVLPQGETMTPFKTVGDFLDALGPLRREQVSLLRSIIQGAQPGLQEHIKWNSPSYVWEGEDRITFNLQNKEGLVKLVFHRGATRPENKKGAPILVDESGLIAWQSDIRGLVSFSSVEDIQAKRGVLETLITRWLAIE